MKIISPLKSQDNLIVLKLGNKILVNYEVLAIIRKTTSTFLEKKLHINWLGASDAKTVFAKQMYRYMLAEFTLYNHVHISYYSGGTEHSIVNNSIKKINDLVFSDTQVAFKVNELRKLITDEIKERILS